MSSPDERRRLILARAHAVPEGFVTTYGDLWPPAPRLAGHVIATCDEPGVPWQRIVRADGTPTQGERQRRLLRGEGVPFAGARVSMEIARVPAEALYDLTRGDR